MSKGLIAASVAGVLLLGGAGFAGFHWWQARPASAPAVVTCATTTPKPAKGELRLEGDPWSGYITTRSPEYTQALKVDGYKYSYHEETDQSKRACNMTTGNIDFMVTTLGQFIQHHPRGKVVGMIDASNGADALVLNTKDIPYLKSVDQLPKLVREYKARGQKPVLVYTGDSPSEELLHELSNVTEELKLSDFELVSVDQSSTAYDKLQKHQAQVAIVWEPDTTAARKAGYTVALSSKDVPYRVLDIIVASERIISEDPAAVQAVVTEFYKARQWNVVHPDKFLKAIAEDGKLEPADAQAVLDGIILFGVKDADRFLNTRVFPLDQQPISESTQAIASIMALTDPGIAVSDSLWDGTFARRAAQDVR